MARAVEGRKKFQCTRCVLGSLYDRVLRVCVPDKSGSRRSKKEVKTLGTFWKDKFMGGRHLQRVVDVVRLRTLNWCRRCAGWASENRLGKHLWDVCELGD